MKERKRPFSSQHLMMVAGTMSVCVFSHYFSSHCLPLSLHRCLYLHSSPIFHSVHLSPGLCLFVIKLKCFQAFHPSAGGHPFNNQSPWSNSPYEAAGNQVPLLSDAVCEIQYIFLQLGISLVSSCSPCVIEGCFCVGIGVHSSC